MRWSLERLIRSGTGRMLNARLSAFADVRRSRDARLPPPVCCPSPCSACERVNQFDAGNEREYCSGVRSERGLASGRRDSYPYVALESDGIAAAFVSESNV